MPRYDKIRADALELFHVTMSAARRTDLAETLRRLIAARERLEDSQLTVVVCGEFKQGKSTLLNALLDQKDELFPTGTSYTTSHVTKARYGAEKQISVQLAIPDDDASEQLEERQISPAELRDYVTQDGNAENGQRVLSASITLPSDPLASGLVLVDTPGIGGVYTEHTAATNAVLPFADAIVFVADIHRPLTMPEIRFLTRATEVAEVGDDKDALICVLTRIDQETDYEKTVAEARAALAEAIGWPVPVVPVSSRLKIKYLTSRDEEDLVDSNFPALETLLWDTLARRRAKAVLAGALADLDGSAAALLGPYEAELSVLRAAGPAAAAAVREAIGSRRRALGGLSIDAATWRADLVRDTDEMSREVLARVLEHADRAWLKVRGYLDDAALLDDTNRLLGRVDEDLSTITGIGDRMLYDRAARLQQELAGRLGLTVWSTEIRRLPAPPVPTVREVAPPSTEAGPRGGLGTSSIVSIGSTVGSVLGRVVAIFVAPGADVVGGVIGAGAGLLITGVARLAKWRDPDNVARRQSRAEVRRELGIDLDDYYTKELRPHFAAHVQALSSEWAALIATETQSLIRQEQASAAAAANRVGELSPQDIERAAAREAELLAVMEPLNEVRRRVVELAEAAAELAANGRS